MALEDCGVEALKEEVLQQSKEDYDAFKKFIYVGITVGQNVFPLCLLNSTMRIYSHDH